MMDILWILLCLLYVVAGLFSVRAWHFKHPMQTYWKRYRGEVNSVAPYVWGRLFAFTLWPLLHVLTVLRFVGGKTIVPAWVWFFTDPKIRTKQREEAREAQRLKDIRNSYDLAVEFYGDGKDQYGIELAKLQLQLAESMGEFIQLDEDEYYEWRAKNNALNQIRRLVSHDEQTAAREIARNTSR